ncbi:hypothetical protein CK203_038650 [Vitis vinifera]|uniref:Uncharacterized protein n=1 Tax=Vitis vinifera TaxID=29760 RepID=A0A438HV47_VITVI|nr:hypothetical protein CK203_038650 [Vitis vinifera]
MSCSNCSLFKEILTELSPFCYSVSEVAVIGSLTVTPKVVISSVVANISMGMSSLQAVRAELSAVVLPGTKLVGRQASLEEEAASPPEKRAWAVRGWVSGSGALGQIGDLLQALLAVDAALDLSHTQNIGRMIKSHFPHSQAWKEHTFLFNETLSRLCLKGLRDGDLG